MFEGYTYYVHKVFHDIFAFSNAGQEINKETIINTVGNILEENIHVYNETMASLSLVQKQVLIAIAKSKAEVHPTSGAFVRKNSLPSPSSTQKALKALLDGQLITYSIQPSRNEKIYMVSDNYFEIWLRETY